MNRNALAVSPARSEPQRRNPLFRFDESASETAEVTVRVLACAIYCLLIFALPMSRARRTVVSKFGDRENRTGVSGPLVVPKQIIAAGTTAPSSSGERRRSRADGLCRRQL